MSEADSSGSSAMLLSEGLLESVESRLLSRSPPPPVEEVGELEVHRLLVGLWPDGAAGCPI